MEFEFATNLEVPEAEFETRVPSDYRQFYSKGNDGIYKVGEGIPTDAAGMHVCIESDTLAHALAIATSATPNVMMRE